MRFSTVLMVAAMTLAACQTMPEKMATSTAPAPVTREQVKIRAAQTSLKQLGYYRSGIDGIAGPRTSTAVQRARADLGLAQTGGIDGELQDFMNRYLELNPPRPGIPPAADVFAAQRGLKRLGYYGGQVNGLYDSPTLAAVLAYRRKTGLPITEKVDANLLRRIEADSITVASG